MDQFRDGLFRMLFKFEVIRLPENEYAVMIFAIGCATIGFLTVAADLAFYVIRGQSLLELKHSVKSTAFFFVAWAFGAMIIGYIGQVINIFQVSLLACATVGVAWPVVFAKVLEKAQKKEEEQKSTDEEKP